MMRAIVGMEKSGMIRSRLRARGIDAWSFDKQPADDHSPHHIVDDVFDHLHDGWDFGIFHPMCTYLTGSAAWAFSDPDFDRYPGIGYHQRVKPETLTGEARRQARAIEVERVKVLDALPYPTVLENPGRSFIATMYRKPDQIIQPYQFGDDASKATGLWLSGGLVPLTINPDDYVAPRMVDGKPRWANQTDSGQNKLPPSDDRWNQRSKTYPGIADALATQIPDMILNPRQRRLAV
jgi:hypothetical protein